MTSDTKCTTWLSHSLQPYIGMGLACGLMFVGLVVISTLVNSWTPVLQAGWLPPALLAAWVALGMRYKICYSKSGVSMFASGINEVHLQWQEVQTVVSESSIDAGRPFRRVALYGSLTSAALKRIDISLKHFKRGDIEGLLKMLAESRPDLPIPRM